MTRFRIAGKGRVNHSAQLDFRFDGREFQGLQGDSVASALLAKGIHLMDRPLKDHPPRRPVSDESEKSNICTTMQQLRQGLILES